MTTESVELPVSGVQFRPYPASVGRDVHYTSYDTEHETKACRAAKVTIAEDDAGRVGLRVFHPTGDEVLLSVEGHHIDDDIAYTNDLNNAVYGKTTEPGPKGRQPGTWHWPERM